MKAATLLLALLISYQPQSGVAPVQSQAARVVRALGVSVRDARPSELPPDGRPGDVNAGEGAYVTSVTSNGPASKGGVRSGDIFVEFDTERVRSAVGLIRVVAETPSGLPVRAVVLRDGKRVNVTVTPRSASPDPFFEFQVPPEWGDRSGGRPPILEWPYGDGSFRHVPPQPRIPPYAPPLPYDNDGPKLGVTVQPLTPQLRLYFNVQHGVLVAAVSPGTPAARAGLKAGDVITAVGDRSIDSQEDLRQALGEKRSGDVVTLAIVRDRKPMTIRVTLARVLVKPINEVRGRRGDRRART